jgi:ABC-type glycerol-3-phosphate transport system substrate-binding protein
VKCRAAIFAVSIIVGVVIFATQKSASQGSGVPVVIWGTLPNDSFTAATSELTQGSGVMQMTYVEKRADTFYQQLIESLASGAGPDIVLLPQDLIVRLRDKILPIPYTTMSLRTFTDTFIQEGSLYLDSSGILAVPFTVDPLVMYWNRDMLTNAGLPLPPKTWDEFISLAPKLTVKDKNVNILKSAVALGEYRNITNSKDIISAILLQTGNPIITTSGNSLVSTLRPATLSSIGAINFYTDFANPIKPDYSWNRSLPNSLDMFI